MGQGMLDADLGFLIKSYVSKLLPTNRILTDGLYENDHFLKSVEWNVTIRNKSSHLR